MHLVQAQLIKDSIGLLHNKDLFVTALVFDGTFGNQSTATQLGYVIDLSNIQTWFPHHKFQMQRFMSSLMSVI